MKEAIRECEDGVLVNFIVSAGGKEVRVPAGYDEWRKSIKIILTEERKKGRANQQLLKELSSLFEIPLEKISIVHGEKDSRKIVKIEGLSREEVEKRLYDASK